MVSYGGQRRLDTLLCAHVRPHADRFTAGVGDNGDRTIDVTLRAGDNRHPAPFTREHLGCLKPDSLAAADNKGGAADDAVVHAADSPRRWNAPSRAYAMAA